MCPNQRSVVAWKAEIEKLGLLKALDIVSVKRTFSLKPMAKKILQRFGLYRSPHGEPVTASFYISLYAEMWNCKTVLLMIAWQNKRPPSDCYINGKLTKIYQIDGNLFFAEKEIFCSYENVISFRYSDSVKSVEAFCIFDISSIDTRAILAGRYRIEDFQHNIVMEGCSNTVKAIREDVQPVFSWIMNAQIRDESSEFKGLYYPAYDMDYKTYRLSSWVWTNAVIVKTFLTEADQGGISEFTSRARSLMDRILDFQKKEGEHAGAFMARWDIFDESPHGIVPILATNDSAFIGAYALIPAFEFFGEAAYLAAAIQLGRWIIEKGMTKDGQLYVGYRLDIGKWVTNYQFVDAGFTTTLFESLFRHTGETIWQDAIHSFMGWFIEKLFDDSRNYFLRIWYDYRKVAAEPFTRGQAWAMDGLLSAYYATNDSFFLDVLHRLAQTLISHQHADGSWTYLLTNNSSGKCSKAIPIIAYHLLRLAMLSEQKDLFDAAAKALAWCDANICLSKSDQRLYGGFYSRSKEGTIYGPPNVASIFTYSLCYYVLAKHLLNKAQ